MDLDPAKYPKAPIYCYNLPSGHESCTNLVPLSAPASRENFHDATETQLSALQLVIDATETQLSALQLVIDATRFYDMNAASSRLKAASIATSQGVIHQLGPDQWISELRSWEALIWANMQNWFSEYATGMAARIPWEPEYQRKPETEAKKRICHSQRMRSPGGFAYVYSQRHSF
jgi:hypothetical protein